MRATSSRPLASFATLGPLFFAAATLTLVIGLAGCANSGDGAFAASANGEDPGLASPWETDTTYSPTGTVLVEDEVGYKVLDEVCGDALADPDYADRFLTPMFRDVAVSGDLAYLVDGSHVWTVDISDAAAPERVDIQPLAGHPVAVHVAAGRLWVATIDAGLRGYALSADGLVLGDDVEVALTEHGRVMDVDGVGQGLYVALGADGLAGLTLDGAGSVAATELHAAGPYANAVSVAGGRVLVAACDYVHVFATATPEQGRGLEAQADFAVPFGSAKGVAADGDQIYVSAGVALLGFRVSEDGTVAYLGHYRDEVAGFYVNEAVADGGFLYLAAGDQSVRALDLGDMELEPGQPVTWDEPAPELDDAPQQMPMPTVTNHTVPKDPIAIDIRGHDLLVLGNFRYVGERTLEVMDVSIPGWLRPAGSYIQPNVALGVSAFGELLVVHDSTGLHHVVDPDTLGGPSLVSAFEFAPKLAGTATFGQDLYLYGEAGPVVRARGASHEVAVDAVSPDSTRAHGMAVAAGRAYISDAQTDGVLVMDTDTGALLGVITQQAAFLGDAALHVHGDTLLAYDRVLGEILTFDATHDGLPALVDRTQVGLCEAYDIADFYSGAIHAKAEMISQASDVYVVCPRLPNGSAQLLRLEVDAETGVTVANRSSLPALTYADAVMAGEHVILASFDNNRYFSTILTCNAETGAVLSEALLPGHANALIERDGQVYVVDGDSGLWTLSANDLTLDVAQPLAF